jgi:hypothetical protein
MKKETLKNEVTMKKDAIVPVFGDAIFKNTTDGEIFKLIRDLQESSKENDVEIGNLPKVYHWVIEYRDEIKKAG